MRALKPLTEEQILVKAYLDKEQAKIGWLAFKSNEIEFETILTK